MKLHCNSTYMQTVLVFLLYIISFFMGFPFFSPQNFPPFFFSFNYQLFFFALSVQAIFFCMWVMLTVASSSGHYYTRCRAIKTISHQLLFNFNHIYCCLLQLLTFLCDKRVGSLSATHRPIVNDSTRVDRCHDCLMVQ